MGGWAVAQSPILVTTITLKRLIQRGYESLLSYYESISPQLNEPLYTRPAWPALSSRRVQWSCLRMASADKCERRTSSVTTGEAVYSITCWRSCHSLLCQCFKGLFFIIPPFVSFTLLITTKALGSIFSISVFNLFSSSLVTTE